MSANWIVGCPSRPDGHQTVTDRNPIVRVELVDAHAGGTECSILFWTGSDKPMASGCMEWFGTSAAWWRFRTDTFVYGGGLWLDACLLALEVYAVSECDVDFTSLMIFRNRLLCSFASVLQGLAVSCTMQTHWFKKPGKQNIVLIYQCMTLTYSFLLEKFVTSITPWLPMPSDICNRPSP
jgi:hypothetical protein